MLTAVTRVSSLLLGIGVLLVGSGMIGTLLGLRASHEAFSDSAVGIVMSAFFAGYIAGAQWCPRLIQRVGHIRTFAALAATAACVALLYGLAVNPYVWFVLRFVNGVAIVGIYMVIESWLNTQTREGRVGVFSVYMMICLAAQGVGQYLLLIYGPLNLASFALVAILFVLGLIPIALTPVDQPAPVAGFGPISFRRLYELAPAGAAGSLVSGIVTGAFWGLSAIFGRQAGLDTVHIAHFIAAAIFGGVLVQWPVGHASDRSDRRVVMVWVTLATALGTLVMAWPQLPAGGLIAGAAVFGGFGFTLYGLAVAQTHDRVAAGEALEATKGLLLLFGLGAAGGPLLLGVLMDVAGYRALPAAMTILLLALAFYLRRRIRLDAPVPAEEQGVFVPVTRTSTVALELDPRTQEEHTG